MDHWTRWKENFHGSLWATWLTPCLGSSSSSPLSDPAWACCTSMISCKSRNTGEHLHWSVYWLLRGFLALPHPITIWNIRFRRWKNQGSIPLRWECLVIQCNLGCFSLGAWFQGGRGSLAFGERKRIPGRFRKWNSNENWQCLVLIMLVWKQNI